MTITDYPKCNKQNLPARVFQAHQLLMKLVEDGKVKLTDNGITTLEQNARHWKFKAIMYASAEALGEFYSRFRLI